MKENKNKLECHPELVSGSLSESHNIAQSHEMLNTVQSLKNTSISLQHDRVDIIKTVIQRLQPKNLLKGPDCRATLAMTKGFTLAEVLITLSILGVVAAISIPNIISRYNKNMTEVKFKIAYSMLTNVIDRISAEYNKPIDTIVDEAYNSSNAIEYFNNNYLRQYLKFTKECKPNDANCSIFVAGDDLQNLKKMNGETINQGRYNRNYMWEYALPNGMFLGVNTYNGQSLPLVVDLNGSKGPNKLGYDIFYFAIYATEYDMRKDNSLVCFVNGANYTPEYFWVRNCEGDGIKCACSIIDNNFKIPSNYPVKF